LDIFFQPEVPKKSTTEEFDLEEEEEEESVDDDIKMMTPTIKLTHIQVRSSTRMTRKTNR
jgi:hypothetical protein